MSVDKNAVQEYLLAVMEIRKAHYNNTKLDPAACARYLAAAKWGAANSEAISKLGAVIGNVPPAYLVNWGKEVCSVTAPLSNVPPGIGDSKLPPTTTTTTPTSSVPWVLIGGGVAVAGLLVFAVLYR